MGTSPPEDRSFWPFFVRRGATVVSLGTGSSGSPAAPHSTGSELVRVTRREAMNADSGEEDMETTQNQDDEGELASVVGAGAEMEMEVGDVFEDDELEAEADVVSTLSSERDGGYAPSGRVVRGAGAGQRTPSIASISVSVSLSSTLVEPSTSPIRVNRAWSSSIFLPVSAAAGVMRPRSASISTSASASSRSRSSRPRPRRSMGNRSRCRVRRCWT